MEANRFLFRNWILALIATLVAPMATLAPTGPAGAVPFVANMQGFAGYGVPIPIVSPIIGFGDATVGASGTVMIAPGAFALVVDAAPFVLSQSGIFTSRPFLTTVSGGHPACLNLGGITGNKMPDWTTTTGGTAMATLMIAGKSFDPATSVNCSHAFVNDAGTFSPGGGPGTVEWCYGVGAVAGPCTITGLPASQQPAEVNITPNPAPSAAQFGGTLGVLGVYKSGLRISNPFTPAGGYFDALGFIPMTALGRVVGETAKATGLFTHETLGFTIPAPGTLVGFPWSTGQFKASEITASLVNPSVVTATGHDNRTSMFQNGNLQMVSGWVFNLGGIAPDTTVGQWVMSIEFVPEPGSAALLMAGLLGLPVAYRLRNRR